jgi:phosphatidylglycerol:prolipoprotein diacylglycerol transferase
VHPVLFHIGAILIPSYGAVAAIGVLLALFLAQRTARTAGLNAGQVWNLCVVSVFAALAAQRLLLVVINLGDLRHHPTWLLALAMVHHPLLAAAGAAAGLVSGAICARWQKLPFRKTADVLAAPMALGQAFEQLGALMAGSGYGTETTVRWAVIYTHPLAALWSGTPLGIPLHPVQAYAAMAFLTLSIVLIVWQSAIRQPGDLAGLGLMGIGVAVYLAELWRDTDGRGVILGGALDGPQIGATVLVLAGALLLLERKASRDDSAVPSFRQQEGERVGHGALNASPKEDEAAHG